MEQTSPNLHERLAQFFAQERLTVGEAAEKISIPFSTLYGITRGTSTPRMGTLLQVKAAFPCLSLAWLLQGRGEMYQEPLPSADDPNHDTEGLTLLAEYWELTRLYPRLTDRRKADLAPALAGLAKKMIRTLHEQERYLQALKEQLSSL